MSGIKCLRCNGKGYIEEGWIKGHLIHPVKVWCEACKGTGQVKWEGKREGIEWERE